MIGPIGDCLCNAIAGMDVVSPTDHVTKTKCASHIMPQCVERAAAGTPFISCQDFKWAHARLAAGARAPRRHAHITDCENQCFGAWAFMCRVHWSSAPLHTDQRPHRCPALPAPSTPSTPELHSNPSAAHCRVNRSLGNRHPAGTAGTRYTPVLSDSRELTALCS